MTNSIDLTGRRFGFLTVLSRSPRSPNLKSRDARWLCRCDCGNETVVAARNLKNGATKSCGCAHAENLSGKRFGRLIAISRVKRADLQSSQTFWKCLCDCGRTHVVSAAHLKDGTTISCGCYAREATSERSKTHGMTKTRLYRIWLHMKDRCLNPKHVHFKCYGGRGISICKEWVENFESFRDWALSNGYQKALTLDRINNNENYCPENCRWVSATEQNRNTSRNIFYQGKCLKEWAEALNIDYALVRGRIWAGWSIEKSLTTPVRKKTRK